MKLLAAIVAGLAIGVTTGVATASRAQPRAAGVEGRVFDESGHPAAGVRVSLLRRTHVDGHVSVAPVATATTDERGAFRLTELAPGAYYLSAAPVGRYTHPRATEVPVTTYYPGSADFGLAQRIVLAPGAAPSLALSLLRGVPAEVSGTVLDSRGQPLSGRGAVIAVRREASMAVSRLLVPVAHDGTFRLGGLVPGVYELQASVLPSAEDSGEFTSIALTVHGGQAIRIPLTTRPVVRVAGRIVVPEGSRPLPYASLRVGTWRADTGDGGTRRGGEVKSDYTFTLDALPVASVFSVGGLASGWSVESVDVRGQDILDTGVDLRSVPRLTDVRIRVTDRPSRVSGVVVAPDGDRADRQAVVVFSTDPRGWILPRTRYVRATESDERGEFEIVGLPPGSYAAVALSDVDPLQAGDPEHLAIALPHAARLAIRSGQAATVRVPVVALLSR